MHIYVRQCVRMCVYHDRQILSPCEIESKPYYAVQYAPVLNALLTVKQCNGGR